jgi:hypothetical protein
MKLRKDGMGFSLESAEEVAEFQKLVDFGLGFKKAQRDKAQRVFDTFVQGSDTVDLDDQSEGASIAANEWADRMSSAILNDLDHLSIGDFVELVLKSHQKASQAAKARKRHAENHAMKADVYQWLDANMGNFKSMDAAAEAIAGNVVPIVFRTARDWVGQWKKLRSTGTP